MIKWFMMFFLMFMLVFNHELTHYQIYRSYGCEDIKWGLFDHYALAYVQADCSALDIDEYAGLRQAQAFNEVIGYNVLPFLLLIICLILFDNRIRKVIFE